MEKHLGGVDTDDTLREFLSFRVKEKESWRQINPITVGKVSTRHFHTLKIYNGYARIHIEFADQELTLVIFPLDHGMQDLFFYLHAIGAVILRYQDQYRHLSRSGDAAVSDKIPCFQNSTRSIGCGLFEIYVRHR